jgi:hypothetical protein
MNKGPYKMKAGAEGPMRKNFPAAFKDKDEPTRTDSIRAVNMRTEYIKTGKSEEQIDKEYDQIPDAKKSRKILNETDKKTKDKNQTKDVLIKSLRKSDPITKEKARIKQLSKIKFPNQK